MAALAPVAVAIIMEGDTMTVRVHRHAQTQSIRDPFYGTQRVQVLPALVSAGQPRFFLEPGESARVVRGRHPEKLP